MHLDQNQSRVAHIWNEQVSGGLSMNISSPAEWASCALNLQAVCFPSCQVAVWHSVLVRLTHASWILCLHLVYFSSWNYKFHGICNYDFHTIMCTNTILDRAKCNMPSTEEPNPYIGPTRFHWFLEKLFIAMDWWYSSVVWHLHRMLETLDSIQVWGCLERAWYNTWGPWFALQYYIQK